MRESGLVNVEEEEQVFGYRELKGVLCFSLGHSALEHF